MNKFLLAIDQSTSCSGWALFKDGKLDTHGKVKANGETLERIVIMRNWLIKMTDALKSHEGATFEVVLEDIQLQQDVVTFKTLAWLQGTLLTYLEENKIKHRVYFSTEWKKTCGVKGAGRTEQKRNAQKYVQDVFGIKATQDECDAICLGKHALSEDDKVINW